MERRRGLKSATALVHSLTSGAEPGPLNECNGDLPTVIWRDLLTNIADDLAAAGWGVARVSRGNQ